MKNRGFTLIELLSVILILGVLGTIITISVTKTLKSTHVKECETFVKKIEDSACTYVALKNKTITCNRNLCPDFKLSVLVSEGFITEEVDPCTKEDIDLSATISVRWNDVTGEKICTYNGVKEYAG